MADAPIVRVSARHGEGVEAVREAVADVLSARPRKSDLGRPRLPIDRVFSMPGFGTVVTGTLVDGRLITGAEVEIVPEEIRARVRGLQAHNEKTEAVPPGTRTAVNLSGVAVEDIARGSWLVLPDTYPSTRRLDLQVRILPDARLPVRHDDEVKFFIGAAEVMGRARVLGVDELLPGEQGWLQLEVRAPVIARRGDRFILRRPSPGETIGGGAVVDPTPAGRHRRFAKDLVARLESLAGGTPQEILSQALADQGEAAAAALAQASALNLDTVLQLLSVQAAAGDVLLIEGDLENIQAGSVVAAKPFWQGIRTRILEELGFFHERFPLRLGMPREDLRSRIRASTALFRAALESLHSEGKVVLEGALAAAAEHEVRFTDAQQDAVRRMMAAFAAQPFATPGMKQVRAELGDEVAESLVAQGRLVQVSPEVVFRAEDYQHMLKMVKAIGAESGEFTVANVRDRFGTSRKYVLAFLEYLDSIGVTERVGEGRRLK
jgi:selenocysteine-specific elongation factor